VVLEGFLVSCVFIVGGVRKYIVRATYVLYVDADSMRMCEGMFILK